MLVVPVRLGAVAVGAARPRPLAAALLLARAVDHAQHDVLLVRDDVEPGVAHRHEDVAEPRQIRKARPELRSRDRPPHEDLVGEFAKKALVLELELAQRGVLRQPQPGKHGKPGLLRVLEQPREEARGGGRLLEVHERLAHGRADLNVEPRVARLGEDVVVLVDVRDAARDRVLRVGLPREAVAERRDGHGPVDAHLLAQLLEQRILRRVARALAVLDGPVALGLVAGAHELLRDGRRGAAARRHGRGLAHGREHAQVRLRHLEVSARGRRAAAAAVAQAHARLRDAVDNAAVAPRHGLLLRGHDRGPRRGDGALVGQERRVEQEAPGVLVEVAQLDAPVREVARDCVKVGRARVHPRPQLDAHAGHCCEVDEVLGPVARRDDERLRDRANVLADDAHEVVDIALVVAHRLVRADDGVGLRADDQALPDDRAVARGAILEHLDQAVQRHAQRPVALPAEEARVHKDVGVEDDDVAHARAARADRARRLVKGRRPR